VVPPPMLNWNWSTSWKWWDAAVGRADVENEGLRVGMNSRRFADVIDEPVAVVVGRPDFCFVR
jgi:hypothetical protein